MRVAFDIQTNELRVPEVIRLKGLKEGPSCRTRYLHESKYNKMIVRPSNEDDEPVFEMNSIDEINQMSRLIESEIHREMNRLKTEASITITWKIEIDPLVAQTLQPDPRPQQKSRLPIIVSSLATVLGVGLWMGGCVPIAIPVALAVIALFILGWMKVNSNEEQSQPGLKI